MAMSDAATTFGASIVSSPQKSRPDDALLPPPIADSPALTPATSHEDIAAHFIADGTTTKPIPPHSPFYQHPPASFERVHSRQSSKNNLALPNEKDLESGLTPLATRTDDEEANPFTSIVSIEHNKECKMWPSKQTLMQQRTEERRKKHATKAYGPIRTWWSQHGKRQKLIMKLIFALVIIGAIVGICVGISVKVHGTYYAGDKKGQQEVGQQ